MVDHLAARHQIDVRLSALKARPFTELALLPPCSVEEVRFGPDVWSLSVYRDVEPESVRIIVQIGPPQRKFLFTHVQADGFRVHRDGILAPVSERELCEFR